MRVTERMFMSDFLANIGKGRERVNRLNNQLGAQKRILKASDDPGGAESVMRVDADLARIERYRDAITTGGNSIKAAGTALRGIGNALQSAKGIAAGAENTGDPALLGSLADQIDQILNATVDLANTKYDGKYLFGGTNTVEEPFSIDTTGVPDTAVYHGNAIPLEYQVGEGIRQTVSLTGQEVFLNGPAGSDMFSVLIGMRDSLRAGSAPTAAQLQALDDAQTLVLQSEGKAGTISQILDRTSTYLASQKEQLLSLRAAKQEIDVAEIGVKLQYEQTMLDAALAAGAKILPRSLMDFLT